MAGTDMQVYNPHVLDLHIIWISQKTLNNK